MSDIVERLRHFCTDWDGSAMDDHTEPMPGLHCTELREAADEITRLRAALSQQAGWKLVPVEPTPKMLVAMAEAWQMADKDECLWEYRAALAAAPQPGAQAADGVTP